MVEPPVPSRHFCRTHLGHVHHVVAGPDRAPTVVLLHQTPRSIDEFAEVIPLLSRRYRVVAIDTPGYGCSDHPAAQPSVADYARAVVEVLDAVGCGRVWVAGHHTGAVIGVELAASHRDRIAGLALSGPVYLDRAGRDALSVHFAQWHVRPDGSHLTEKWAKFSRWATEPRLVHRLIVDLLVAGETSEFGHFAIVNYPMEQRLPPVSCPGVLIYGTRDPFTGHAQAAPFRAALQPVREVDIEGGVFLPNEAPEPWADAVQTLVG